MCDIKSSDGAYLIIKKGDLGAVKISLGEKYDFVNYNNIIDDSSNKKRYNLPDIFKEIIPREHWNGKKRVLIVIDQYGWAFDFGARGIKKYSKFNCTIKKHDKVTDKDIRTSDVIFFMCSAMWFAVKKKHAKALLENRNDVLYCVGLRASHVEGNEHIPPDNLIDVIGCISKTIVDSLRNRLSLLVLTVHLKDGVEMSVIRPLKLKNLSCIIILLSNQKTFSPLRVLSIPLKNSNLRPFMLASIECSKGSFLSRWQNRLNIRPARCSKGRDCSRLRAAFHFTISSVAFFILHSRMNSLASLCFNSPSFIRFKI